MKSLKLIDCHAHLQSSVFNKDREKAIKRAVENGIGVVNVGADKKSSVKAVELAKKYPNKMRATVGCHPHYIDKDFINEEDYDFLKKLAQEPEVVAIGECGLDYFFRNEKLEMRDEIIRRQKEVFIKHIELAKEVNKPLMIHCREAFDDLIKILKTEINPLRQSADGGLSSSPGILHFFTGALENAKQLLEMGFYFTFNGLITFNRDFDDIIKYIPLDRILLETDAPYVAPLPYRGKKNEPAYIVETVKKMAEIKGISSEKINEQTTVNARNVLNI